MTDIKERKITLKSATEAMRKIRVGQFNPQTYLELEEEVWEFLNGLRKEKETLTISNDTVVHNETKEQRVEENYLVLSRGVDSLQDVNDKLQSMRYDGFTLKKVIELNEMIILVMERKVYG